MSQKHRTNRRDGLWAYLWTLLVVVLVICSPVALFAQASDPGSAPAPTTEGLLVALITTVGAASVSLLTAGVKKLLPSIPRILLPTIVIPTLGVLAAWTQAVATGGHFSVVKAALMALGALYLRETFDTLAEHRGDPIERAD